jgi:transcriptional regulator with XRE-family HTH domain
MRMRDIRATRDRLGLSTAELARLVGVSYRAAHAWMQGANVPEPVWRLLEIWEVAQPETIRIVLAQGYAVETKSPSEQQKRERVMPVTIYANPAHFNNPEMNEEWLRKQIDAALLPYIGKTAP